MPAKNRSTISLTTQESVLIQSRILGRGILVSKETYWVTKMRSSSGRLGMRSPYSPKATRIDGALAALPMSGRCRISSVVRKRL